MGIGKARVSLDQIGEASAEKYVAKCSFCELTDEGKARGAEIAANRVDRAIKKVQKRKEKSAD
jgi:hypothetical protein